jgi:hypothetical protein
MADRVLRSNPDKTNLLSPLLDASLIDSTTSEPVIDKELIQQPLALITETNAFSSTSFTNLDFQMMMQMFQKSQVDTNKMHQELKEDFIKLTTEVKNLKSMIKQGESHSLQEMENMQDQIEVIKLANSALKSAANQSTSVVNNEGATTQGVQFPTMIHTQSYSLLRIALDKQIDEVKPYFGKKQENIDSWIRKIDKVAEIARMPDDEVFTLAKLKLQGDAEKWWDNKKKEIHSWATLKSKLADTFGALGKSNKLELEALLHHRQQQFHEPAAKYWNDMMSNCSAYDENMSTQDRVWRIFKGALPEFRNKYENKTFDDVDQILKALIQHEENRLRVSSEDQQDSTQVSNLVRGPRPQQNTSAPTHQQFSNMDNQPVNYQQQQQYNPRTTDIQQPNSRFRNNNGRWNSNHPN